MIKMPLDKAIEIINLNIRVAGKKMPPDVRAALTLGIEALKHIKHGRSCQGNYVDNPLPDETND